MHVKSENTRAGFHPRQAFSTNFTGFTLLYHPRPAHPGSDLLPKHRPHRCSALHFSVLLQSALRFPPHFPDLFTSWRTLAMLRHAHIGVHVHQLHAGGDSAQFGNIPQAKRMMMPSVVIIMTSSSSLTAFTPMTLPVLSVIL